MNKIYRAYYIKQEDYEGCYDEVMQGENNELISVFNICSVHLQICSSVAKVEGEEEEVCCLFVDCDHCFDRDYMPQAIIVLIPVNNLADIIVGSICEDCCVRPGLDDRIWHYLSNLTTKESIEWDTSIRAFGVKSTKH
jgi:hypothetical protein